MEAQNNIYSLLDENTSTAFGQSLSFTIGQTGSLLSISTLVMFMFLIAIAGAGAGRFLYALALRVGTFGEASEANYTKSKQIMNTVLFTLFFSFGLVLLGLAVNPDLVRGTVGWEGLRVSGGVGTQPGAGTAPTQPTPTSSSYAARLASHNAVVARLNPSGIKTNHNNVPCTEAQYSERFPSCTSLAYLPEQTIQMLLKINGDCRCTLIITGATEPGHAENGNHGENKRGVDLRIKAAQDTSDPLYDYVVKMGRPAAASSACYARYTVSTFTFCDEKPRSNSTWNPHFHVD